MKLISHDRLLYDRRSFLARSAIAPAGLGAAAGLMGGCTTNMRRAAVMARTRTVDPGPARVSLVAGGDRRQMVYDALMPFRDEIACAIADKQVLIKLNCVGQNGWELMVTPPDAVRGVLDFLAPLYDRQVHIVESPVQDKNPERTFDIFGYRPLEREYDAVCVDLNQTPTSTMWILDKNMAPQPIRVVDALMDRDNFVFSVTRLKTHNCVVATLSLKNVVMGSPIKIPSLGINEKQKMHATSTTNKSPKMINYNLFLMAHTVRPDFAVLDGFEGVEGNGPANGTPVDHRVAVAGPDFVAVDRIGTELMGIPWGDVGYLKFCSDAGLGQGDRSKITVVGPDPRQHIRKYVLHDNIDWQNTWKDDLVVVPPGSDG